jgi:UDP-2,4-diacetamido-2,4,6-trideoxy-beta-L-altropyranose hydrolase
MGHDLKAWDGRKVLIRADGSRKIGLGHIYRMREMARVMDQAGAVVTFLTLTDPMSGPVLQELVDETGVSVVQIASDQITDRTIELLLASRPDVVVQDLLRTAPAQVVVVRDNSDAFLVHIDDTRAGLTLADAVFNGMVAHWGEYEPGDAKTRLFEGARYLILQDSIRHSHWQDAGLRQVVVAIGGTDSCRLQDQIIHALAGLDEAVEILVTGQLEKHNRPNDLEGIQVRRLGRPLDLYREIAGVALVICGGGVMLWELAALGYPSIAFATADFERHNVALWQKAGTTRAGRLQPATDQAEEERRSVDEVQLAALVEDLLQNPATCRRMSAAGEDRVDFEGTHRIMETIAREARWMD